MTLAKPTLAERALPDLIDLLLARMDELAREVAELSQRLDELIKEADGR